MNIVCLDLEGVLVPEIWIAFAEEKMCIRDRAPEEFIMSRSFSGFSSIEHGLNILSLNGWLSW